MSDEEIEELETEEELTEEEAEAIEETTDEEDEDFDISGLLAGPGENWSSHHICYYGPESRTVLISGEVDHRLAAGVISQIQELSTADPEAPIIVHINTPGGVITDGLAIYDMLMVVNNPIITIVNGACMSAGLIILCAGSIRMATPNAVFFFHQPVVSMLGVDSPGMMYSGHEFYKWCKTKTDNIILERTQMNKPTWEGFYGDRTSVYFDTTQAEQHGWINHLMVFAEKPEFSIDLSTEETEEQELVEDTADEDTGN